MRILYKVYLQIYFFSSQVQIGIMLLESYFRNNNRYLKWLAPFSTYTWTGGRYIDLKIIVHILLISAGIHNILLSRFINSHASKNELSNMHLFLNEKVHKFLISITVIIHKLFISLIYSKLNGDVPMKRVDQIMIMAWKIKMNFFLFRT